MKKIINLFTMFTVIFTLITLVSSIYQLFSGQATDTNAHILIRALFTIVSVGFYGVFSSIKIKNTYLKVIIQYIVSIIFILIIVWGIGFFGELSKTAYRDAFLNWSFIFLSVVLVKAIIKKYIKK
ncbi:DUF6608 family protein [Clostridium sp. C8]|uniref:DUF6608 family protein n=1 Tax=Clostridium sp. C8 TaxID=1667357 RepID=UPI00062E4C07|nr:DUF6608 family protein [Clostridium sp. C8]KLE15695.1 hypothetical protein AAT22_10010 [Clostridium sp. C8]